MWAAKGGQSDAYVLLQQHSAQTDVRATDGGYKDMNF
jgi:hypothetical protein